MAYEFVPHVFAQGHTIEGAIRLHNSLQMLPEHVEMMMAEFNNINKDVFPPAAGQIVKIPIMSEYEVEPVVEPKEVPKEVPKLPPLRLGRKPVVRQMPRPKPKDQKKVPKKLHWWK
jgi:hypothetical protein